MASEREEAKQAATDPESIDPELGDALGKASQFHLDLIKENNRHAKDMAYGERGWLGWLLGGESHAPTFIAFLAATAGLSISVWCLNNAALAVADAEFWSKQAERGFALAATAIGFIFGRNTK